MNTCPHCGEETHSDSICRFCREKGIREVDIPHDDTWKKDSEIFKPIKCPECEGTKFSVSTTWKGHQDLDTTGPAWGWKDQPGRRVKLHQAWCSNCNHDCTEILDKAGIVFSEEWQ
jgi:hypothetical protein